MSARALATGLAAFTCAVAAAIAAPQLRDTTRAVAGPGTASIAGTVFVQGASKTPARRVRVTLNEVARKIPGQTATTGDDGRFAFRGLPAGQYDLQAFRNGYLRSSYGASRPDRAGTPVVVKDGETIADLTMTIARGGVITGIIRDPQGRPVSGKTVRVLRLGYHSATGEANLSAPATSVVSPTDDRGEYRAFGLPPGGYIVIVDPPPSRSGGPGMPAMDDIRPLTSADVQRALQSARAGVTPVAPAAATPAPVEPASRSVGYAPVFHPGVTDIGSAATVAIGVGEERTGVDVVLSLVATSTISGRISSPTGEMPSTLRVMALPAGPRAELLAGAGLRTLAATPAGDGTYTITSVPAGTYTVKAITGTGRGRSGAAPQPDSLSAAVDVNVSGGDVDVPLTLVPGVAVNGRVVFQGAAPTPAELQTLSFRLLARGAGAGTAVSLVGRVDADGRFTFPSLAPDTYRVVETWTAPGASDRWAIASSTANGREAFESPLRAVAGEPVEWTITYTDRPTVLRGVFQDRGGRAATDYFVLVFPADRARWTPGSRRIRMTRPATDGAFSLTGLPPGEYLLGALSDLEEGEWNDPTLLDGLAPFSVRVTLRQGETTRQDVRIGG